MKSVFQQAPWAKCALPQIFLPTVLFLLISGRALAGNHQPFSAPKQSAPPPTRVYVDQYATGSNDGSSWGHAYLDLQTALGSGADTIFVAAGTYFPTTGGNRDALFQIPPGTRLFGGFAGTENDPDERDLQNNQTILSGHIGSVSDITDNTKNLVYMLSPTAGTRLDGFTLTGAYENSALYIESGEAAVVNCVFTANAGGFGGGIRIRFSTINIDRCVFSDNIGSFAAGGLGTIVSTIVVSNSVFTANSTSERGGAYAGLFSGSAHFINCLFTQNVAPFFRSSVVYSDNTAIKLTNCTLADNTSAPVTQSEGNTIELENCILWGNYAGFYSPVSATHSLIQGGFAGIGNMKSDPKFSAPGNYRLQVCSPAVNAGSNTLVPMPATTDADGNPRIFGGTVDMGCYELQTPSFIPAPFEVRGEGSDCPGGNPTPVELSDSQTGVDYQWKINGTPEGDPVPGTGAPLPFGTLSVNGIYTVTATGAGGCTTEMRGSAPVFLGELETTLAPTNAVSGFDTLFLAVNNRPLRRIEWQLDGVTKAVEPCFFKSDSIVVAGVAGYGSETDQLALPTGIGFDAAGNLYVSDQYNHRVLRFAPGVPDGVVVAGGNGEGDAADQLAYPAGLAVLADGTLYIADHYNHRIQKWLPGASSGTTEAGGNGNGSAADQLAFPQDVFVGVNDTPYIADDNNHRIQKWAPAATSGITVAGGNGPGPAANQVESPRAVVLSDGYLFVAEPYQYRVSKWAPGAPFGTTVAGGGGSGTEPNQLNIPEDIAFDPEGNLLVCESGYPGRVSKWMPGATRGLLLAGGDNAPDLFNRLANLALDAAGNLYVSDQYNYRVLKFAPDVRPYHLPDQCGTWRAVATDIVGCTDTSNVATVLTRWHFDGDGDGYGDASVFQITCPQPSGYVADSTDCDDTRNAVNPAADEICNDGLDNNCDGFSLEIEAPVLAGNNLSGCAGELLEVVAADPCLPLALYETPVGGSPITFSTASTTLYAQENLLRYGRLTTVNTAAALAVVDHNAFTGEDGRGIAVTPDYVFYTGDDNTVRYDPDLQNGVQLPRIDGMFSDLATGKLYRFQIGTRFHPDSIDRIQPLTSYGQPAGPPVALSEPLYDLGGYKSGVFNGYGYVLFYSKQQKVFFKICTRTGEVTRIKEGYNLDEQTNAESYWSWYMSEFNGVDYSILYRKQNSELLLRLNLTTGRKDTAAIFQGIGNDAAQFVFSPWHNRLYVHNEGRNFYNGNSSGEWLMAFEAQYTLPCTEAPRTPVTVTITACPPPDNAGIRAGSRTLLSGTVEWSPPVSCLSGIQTDAYVSVDNIPPSNATPPSHEDLFADSLLLGGLECGAVRYIWLRTDCGAVESDWVGPVVLEVLTLEPMIALNATGDTLRLTGEVPPLRRIEWYLDGSLVAKVPEKFLPDAVTVAGGNEYGSDPNQLDDPSGIGFDGAGNLYVADTYNHRAQKFAAGSTEGITVAGGNGEGAAAEQLAYPKDVFVKSDGTLYIADANNHRIQMWLPGAYSGVTVAGGNGEGAAADQLSYPTGIFVDANDTMYIADQFNHRIQKWAPGASAGVTVAGGNGAGAAADQLDSPADVVLKDGYLFIADQFNYRIQKWGPGATSGVTVAGGNGEGTAANQLDQPAGIFFDPEGNLLIAEAGFPNNRVSKWAPGAGQGVVIAGGIVTGSDPDQLNGPGSILLDPAGNLYVSDSRNQRVQKFFPDVPAYIVPWQCGDWQAVATDTAGCQIMLATNTLEVVLRWYADTDTDGYGNPDVYVEACSAPPGYVANRADCDDSDPAVNPAAVEVCNDGKDNNCDGIEIEFAAPQLTESILSGCAGETVEISAVDSCAAIAWYDAPAGGNLLSSRTTDRYVLDQSTILYAQQNPYQYMRLASVDVAATIALTDHNTFTGDDGRGIAVTPDYIYYTGDDASVRCDHNLQNAVSLPRLDGLFSDLATGRIYQFRYGSSFSDQNIDRIQPLDPMGAPDGEAILLSRPLTDVGRQNSVVFSGFGYVIFYSAGDEDFFKICTRTGAVTVLKENYRFTEAEEAETHWAWYPSEYDGRDYSVLYRRDDTNTLLRLNLTSEKKDTVAVFEDLGREAAQFAFSPWDNRLFVHNESGNFYNNDFSGEWLMAFDAENGFQCADAPRTPLQIVVTPCAPPTDPVVREGSITYTTSMLDWTPVEFCNDPVPVDVYLSQSNTPPSGATPPTYDNVAANYLQLQFLECGATYYAWFRTDCGAAESDWVGPVSWSMQTLDNALTIAPMDANQCLGEPATFTVTSIPEGAEVVWFDAATGGNPIDTGAVLTVAPSTSTSYYADLILRDSLSETVSFGYSGGEQTFVVPEGVTQLSVIAKGASGGRPSWADDSYLGLGGKVTATLAVTPGQTLRLYVGGRGTRFPAVSGGYNGGGRNGGDLNAAGGGGATDIRIGGTDLTNRVLVAGGGGGGSQGGSGGAGGGLAGGAGAGFDPSQGGLGGTQTAGGAGGIGETGLGEFVDGNPGGLGFGGDAGCCTFSLGGGGGGYYGGGGGGIYGGAGGGGSSYTDPMLCANVEHIEGDHSGDGVIELAWTAYRTCESAVRTAVNVAVNPIPTAISATNISACAGAGTTCPNDDTYTADITVSYPTAPAFGTLTLSGTDITGGAPSVNVAGIGAASHTFTGVVLRADGAPIELTATFTGGCEFTETNAGTAPACSLPCSVTDISLTDITACNKNNSYDETDDFFTADVSVTFAYAPSGGTLTLKRGTTTVATTGADLTCTTTYTFQDVQLAADGAPVSFTAEFSPTCSFTKNDLMTAPGPCSCVPPSVFTTCPMNLTANVAPASCAATVSYTAEANGDPVPDYDYVFTGATSGMGTGTGSGAAFPVGETTVTLTAANFCGSTTCSFVVTVVDNIPPAITCPENVGVNAPAGQCSAAVTFTAPVGNDNCPGATTMQTEGLASGSFFPTGTTVVTFRATDFASNTSTCSFTVSVTDNQLPGINCPSGVTVACSANIPAVDVGSVSVSDNCSTPTVSHVGDAISNQTCANRKTVTRTYRVTDSSGNSATCSQVITVFDNTQPVFTFVPANVTVQCNSIPAVGTPVATDGCGGSLTITYNGQMVSNVLCTDKYTLTRQWTATDACGNTRTASQKITVTDSQKPAFVGAPANITVQCDAIPPASAPTATDNCATVVAITYAGETRTNGTCLNRYTLTRRWVAADNCGNTVSVSQRISVVDNGKPTLTVPADMAIACSDPIPPVGTATASDGCAGAVTISYLGQSTTSGACPGSYQIKRIWRATDACGNTTAATQTIQVSDNGAPVFVTVPGPLTIECNTPLPPLVNPTASDACGGYVHITFLGNVATGSGCANSYTITRTWRAQDLCGNTASATQVITVVPVPAGFNPQHATEEVLRVETRSYIVNPNPTTDRIWIDLSAFAGEPVTVSILSDLGQLIWENRIPVVEDLLLQVSLREAGAAAGIYTVRVRSTSGVVAKRVVLVD